MKKNSSFPTYLRERCAAFSFAIRGIRLTVNEPHTHIHIVLATIALVLAFVLKISSGEWLALILSITLVFTLEALNTAIESVVDLITVDYHELARDAKDIAAGAVFIAALGALLIGIMIFFPRLQAFALS